MSGVSVRKRKKIYRSFAFSIEGLTAEKTPRDLVFSDGKNCDFSKGRLVSGLGVGAIKSVSGQAILSEFLDEDVASVCVYFENEELKTGASVCVLLKNGRLLFYNSERATFTQVGYGFASDSLLFPVYQKGDLTGIAVIGLNGVRVVYPNGGTVITYQNSVSSIGAFFHGRIFFADGFSVRYGAPFVFNDYEVNADDAGRIELGSEGGEILSIVGVGEKLFTVRQREIVEISAAGAARDFAMKKIAYGGEEIRKGGVCAVGDTLLFLALDGVYRFSQGNFEKIVSGKIADLDERKKVVASAAGGKYRLDYTSTSGEEKTLVVDGEDGSYYFSFGLCGVQNGAFAAGVKSLQFVMATDKGELPTGEECFARVLKVDFGESGEKVARRISCFGRGRVELTVRSNRGEKKASLALTPTAAMEFALKGREFDIEFSLKSGASIERIEVEYDLIGGGK